MSKYQAVYRCLCCNALQRASNPIECTQQQAKDATSRAMFSQQFNSNPYLRDSTISQQMLHMCSDGSVGVAIFAGFAIVN